MKNKYLESLNNEYIKVAEKSISEESFREEYKKE